MPPRSCAHTGQKPRSHTAHTSRITPKQQRTQSPHTPLPSPHDTSPDPCHPSVTDTQNPQDLAHPQKHTPTTPHSTHTQQHSNSTRNPRTPPQQLRAQLPAGLPLPVTQATHAEKHPNSARNPTTAAHHPEGKTRRTSQERTGDNCFTGTYLYFSPSRLCLRLPCGSRK